MSVKISEVKHPNKSSEEAFQQLVGIDDQKSSLLNHLLFFLDPQMLKNWEKKHYPKGFKNNALTGKLFRSPLIILSGEVGCGKTALAHSVATPLGSKLGKEIIVLETPSNIRGGGLVGELSSRITAAFDVARNRVNKNSPGILIIDEADDLATSRSQNEAHHEDRAGLNVLIKQIDQLKTGEIPLAVILITNRLQVLDPAVVRRSELNLSFVRPAKEGLNACFSSLLEGIDYTKQEIEGLVSMALKTTVPYSYSDIFLRVGQSAFKEAIFANAPYNAKALMETLHKTKPTPLLKELNG